MPKFEDTVEAGSMRMTSDGYLVGEVRCARTGIQQYLASDIGIEGSGVVNVYRPEKTVFSKDSMATFAGKPVTLRHPPVAVTADNWKQYAIGDIGEEIARDGEFIRVPIKIMDSAAIRDIQEGVSEISMGYTCDIEIASGVTPEGEHYDAIQTGHIKINHLAAVERARGGSKLRIGDGADNWGASPVSTVPTRDSQKEASMPDFKKVVVDGLTIDTTEQGAQVIVKLQNAVQDSAKALADAETQHKTTIEAKDEEIGQLKADLQAAQAAAVIDVDALVAARAELVTQVKAIDSKIDPTGLTDSELRKAAVVAKLGDEMVADAGDAEISGMFKAISKDANPADPVRDAFGKAEDTAVSDSRQKYLDRLTRKNKES
mgnify:FL=1